MRIAGHGVRPGILACSADVEGARVLPPNPAASEDSRAEKIGCAALCGLAMIAAGALVMVTTGARTQGQICLTVGVGVLAVLAGWDVPELVGGARGCTLPGLATAPRTGRRPCGQAEPKIDETLRHRLLDVAAPASSAAEDARTVKIAATWPWARPSPPRCNASTPSPRPPDQREHALAIRKGHPGTCEPRPPGPPAGRTPYPTLKSRPQDKTQAPQRQPSPALKNWASACSARVRDSTVGKVAWYYNGQGRLANPSPQEFL
jgi:hypothetical protein